MLRLIMMGTGPFAVPTFRRLLATRASCRVARHASAAGTARQAASRRQSDARGRPRSRRADLRARKHQHRRGSGPIGPAAGPICWSFAITGRFCNPRRSPRLASAASICMPRCCLNIAGPRRCNGPIYHGEAETGVSVFQLTAGVDAGPLLGRGPRADRQRRNGRRFGKSAVRDRRRARGRHGRRAGCRHRHAAGARCRSWPAVRRG